MSFVPFASAPPQDEHEEEEEDRVCSMMKRAAISTRSDHPRRTTRSAGDLPASLLGCIIDYLALSDARNFLELKSLRHQQTHQVETLRTICHIQSVLDAAQFKSTVVFAPADSKPCFCNLLQLDLEQYAEDCMMERIAKHAPALQSLQMVGSNGLSGAGLACLGRTEERSGLKDLQYIDVTFCPNVSYEDTLALRGTLHRSDVLIRRQPAWLDGYDDSVFQDKFYIYWPDGSFYMERREEAPLKMTKGFVSELRMIDNDPRHLRRTLQPTDMQPMLLAPYDDWPTWTRFMLKPIVNVMHVEGNDDDDRGKAEEEAGPKNANDDDGSTIAQEKKIGCVLVAQCLQGLCPLDHTWLSTGKNYSMPVGKTLYFERDGTRLLDERDHASKFVRLNRRKFRCLPSLLTPPEVLETNRAFVREKAEFAFPLPENIMEAQLHTFFGGRMEDLEKYRRQRRAERDA